MVERCPDKTEVEGSIPSRHTMEEKKEKSQKDELNRKKNIWWKPAFEIFSEVSTWIIVPIIIALIAGKALDRHYGTSPWLLITLSVISFFFSSYGIVKTVRKYMNKITRDMKDELNSSSGEKKENNI